MATDEAYFELYQQPERHRAKEWRHPGKKLNSVAVLSGFGHKVAAVCAMDIRGIGFFNESHGPLAQQSKAPSLIT